MSFPSIIDLRSDTVTMPTKEMRKAMESAVVGDDVFNEDPTVLELQALASKLSGKQHALFLASGTMGNLCSFLAHADRRGSEIIMGDRSHTFLWEQGGCATLGGIHARAIANNADGTLSLPSIKNAIQPCTGDDVTDDGHYTRTVAVSIENTHNDCGGVPITLAYLKELKHLLTVTNESIRLHVDGARLINASVALNCSLKELCTPTDSVSLCLSKGLGAPVGSLVLSNDVNFMGRVKRARKALGGGWRQAGILASCGIIALENMKSTITRDHLMANQLHEQLKQTELFELLPVHTNMLFFHPKNRKINTAVFVNHLKTEKNVRMNHGYGIDSAFVRMVLHQNIKEEWVSNRVIVKHLVDAYHYAAKLVK